MSDVKCARCGDTPAVPMISFGSFPRQAVVRAFGEEYTEYGEHVTLCDGCHVYMEELNR